MIRLLAVTVALLAVSTAARAQSDAEAEEPPPEAPSEAPPDDPPPDDPPVRGGAVEARGGVRPTGTPAARMTLPGGKILFTAVVEANLAESSAGKPLSVAPDLWIGVSDRLTFGLVHSGRAATGFLTGFGTGLCFRGGGAAGPCGMGLGDVYTFAGAEARIGLTEGGFAVAFVAGAHARAFDPELLLAGKAGFVARLHSSRIAIELAPSAYIGMTQRDFNPDQFGAPVTIFLRLGGRFALAVQGGVTFFLDDVGNTWQVPAAAGFAWWVTPKLSIDAAFGLAAVADSDDATKPFDRRSASVGVGLAL
jgi:hypothetical protein